MATGVPNADLVKKFDQNVLTLERNFLSQPHNIGLLRSLINVLHLHLPDNGGAYVKCAKELSKTKIDADFLARLSDRAALQEMYRDWVTILADTGVLNSLAMTQVQSGTRHPAAEVGLPTCKQLFGCFSKTGIIANACFECFKVQLRPNNLLESIQLHFAMVLLDLPSDNRRKVMVEIREGLSGSCRGYIYGGGEPEAGECKSIVEREPRALGLDSIKTAITHGCSEFSQKYPEFKYQENGQHNSFKPADNWAKIESNYVASLQPRPNFAPHPRLAH